MSRGTRTRDISIPSNEEPLPPKDYPEWNDQGLQPSPPLFKLSLPSEHKPSQTPDDIRDNFLTFGLSQEEEYLISPSVNCLFMGLGWDPGVDVDASAALFDGHRYVVDKVWWKHLQSVCGSVTHSGDNLTGKGSGDDEVITVQLDRVPSTVHYILFTVCIYTTGMTFNNVKEAYVRMRNGDDPKRKGHIMCHYSLTQMSGTSMLMGLLSRKGGYWSFKALGHPAIGRTIDSLLADAVNLRPLYETPSFPPEVKNISVDIIRGQNLAAKDFSFISKRSSSDPYYVLSFKSIKYKSEFIKQTLEPVWKLQSIHLGNLMESETSSLKIEVFDHDALKSDDFMGMIVVHGRLLHSLKAGEHFYWFTLQRSDNPKYSKEKISGRILVKLNVVQINLVELV